ncbi:hypothetical protein BDQ17DRAFT_1349712 [Cyathus striatus]|nr:hypothetical protein BDQ17DRAFT_1349712 [Cyathus striatus]
MQDGEEFEGFIGSGGGVVTSSSGSGTGTGSASVSGSGGGSGSGSGGPRSLVKSPAQALQEMQIHEDEAQAADLDGIVYTRSVRSHPGPSGGGSDSRSRTSLSVSDRPGLGGMNRNATTTTTSHSSTTSFSLSLSHSNSNSVSGPVSPMDPLSPPPVSPTTEKNMKKKRRDTTGSLHPRSPSRSRSKSQTTNSLNKEDEVPPLHSLPLPPLSPFKQTQMQTRSGVSCPGAHSSSSLSVPTAEGGTANGNGDEGKGEGSFPSTGFSSRSRSGSALGSAMGALMLARRGDEFEGY